jgi:hypothetical protein
MLDKGPDVFLLGVSEDARALIGHLLAEAPSLLRRIVAIDPRAEVVDQLGPVGILAVRGSPADPATLRRAGIERAAIVVALGGVDPPRGEIATLIRSLCPGARLIIGARGEPERVRRVSAEPGRPPIPRPVWRRFATWQFWLLTGVTLLDALVFVLPLVSTAVWFAAAAAPACLRRAARFLDALADAG